ncbi:FISUMP domain-containing protein [Saccharicrinis sp. FJH62]|uniref:FISUMP domain-containing protein n=1 Tax=Saccharicrinis sp. FJH62 TaxID=3344657 RepID=UPI0035D3E2AA
MKTYLLSIIFILSVTVSIAQDHRVIFSAVGDYNSIDSIRVENITQGTSVKMGGTDTLLLIRSYTPLQIPIKSDNNIAIYPNPVSDKCNIEFTLTSTESVKIRLFDSSGKLIVQNNCSLSKGDQRLRIENLDKGIYFLSINSRTYYSSGKIISYSGNGHATPEISIKSGGFNAEFIHKKSIKESGLVYLPYIFNDNIIATAMWTNEITTIPFSNVIPLNFTCDTVLDKDFEVNIEFTECIDAMGKSYPTIELGNQVWMAENFKSKLQLGSWSYEDDENNAELYGRLYDWKAAKQNAPEGWHLPSFDEWVQLYGYLNSGSYQTNDTTISGLKSVSHWEDTDEGQTGNGTNTSGMSLLPGGYRNASGYDGLGLTGNYWTSTTYEADTSYSQVWRLFRWNTSIGMGYMTKADMSLSVRYIKDYAPEIVTMAASDISSTEATMNGVIKNDGGNAVTECGFYWSKVNQVPDSDDSVSLCTTPSDTFEIKLENLEPDSRYFYRAFATNNLGTSKGEVQFITTDQDTNKIEYGSFTDSRDGTTYKTIKIGDQTWMAENLAYMPFVNPADSVSTDVPFYFVSGYNGNNINEAKSTYNYATYGVLYNWVAATTASPNGWHLPSFDEWEALTDYIKDNPELFNNCTVTSSLAATSNWTYSPNTGAAGNDLQNNNSSGFSALPGGMCQATIGQFPHIETNGYWWLSTEKANVYGMFTMAYCFNLSYNMGYYFDSYHKSDGFSVRCIKD